MNLVFVINSKDYPSSEGLKNVDDYIEVYYRILERLIPLSYKHNIKIICDEESVCLFENLPVQSISVWSDGIDIKDLYEWDDELVRIGCESKWDLKEFLRLVYPNSWNQIVTNLNTRFL